MLSRLLEDDREWFNIPVIVRDCLRLLVKETTECLHDTKEMRHQVRDVRTSLHEWSHYVTVFETESTQRAQRLDEQITEGNAVFQKIKDGHAKHAENVNRELSAFQREIRTQSTAIASVRAELSELLDNVRGTLQRELEATVKLQSSNIMSHVETLHVLAIGKTDSSFENLSELIKRSRDEMSAIATDVAAQHERTMRHIEQIRNGVCSQVDDLRHEVVKSGKTLNDVSESLLTLDQELSSFAFVKQKSFADLPTLLQSLEQRVGEDRTNLSVEVRRLEGDCVGKFAAVDAGLEDRFQNLVRRIVKTETELLERSEQRHDETTRDFEKVEVELQLVRDELQQRHLNCVSLLDESKNETNDVLRGLQETVESKIFSVKSTIVQQSENILDEARREIQKQCFETSASLFENAETIRVSTKSQCDELRELLKSESVKLALLCDRQEVLELRGATKQEVSDIKERVLEFDSQQHSTTDSLRAEMNNALSQINIRLTEAQRESDQRLNRVARDSQNEVKSLESFLRENSELLKTLNGELAARLDGDVAMLRQSIAHLEVSVDRSSLVQGTESPKPDIEGKLLRCIAELREDVEGLVNQQAAGLRRASETIEEVRQEAAVAREAVFKIGEAIAILEAAPKIDVRTVRSSDEESLYGLNEVKLQVRRLENEVSAVIERVSHSDTHTSETFYTSDRENSCGGCKTVSEALLGIEDEMNKKFRGVDTLCRELEVLVRETHDGANYTKQDIDERFENNWQSVLQLLANKEDRTSLELKMAGWTSTTVAQARVAAREEANILRVELDQKVNMHDLNAMFGSRNVPLE